MVRGSGSLSATTVFQLLDPSVLHGATSFYYDFYLQGGGASADGIWQLWDGAAYQDMVGASGVSGDGDEEWLRGVEVDEDSTGLVRVERTAGDLNYWYTLSKGSGYPSIRGAEGSSDADVEFILEAGRRYTVVSDGSHVWNYWDGSAWVAFAEGTEAGFSFDAPGTKRVQLEVTSGTVVFSIVSVPM